MAVVMPAFPELDLGSLTVHYVRDESLGNIPVVVLFGPSVANGVNANSSRVQAHIFAVAGCKSYSRLTIAPGSTLYAAATELPADKQGDETCRGIAVSLFKYFQEIPDSIKTILLGNYTNGTPAHFLDHVHAAMLVSRMVRVETAPGFIARLLEAFPEQTLSWSDIDIVVAADSTTTSPSNEVHRVASQSPETESNHWVGGPYSNVIESFGNPAFLPTSKLRRAPSRPTGLARPKALNGTSLARLSLEIEELRDTELNYLQKLRDLTACLENAESQAYRGFSSSSGNAVQPPSTDLLGSLHAIIAVSEDFLARIRLLSDTSATAILRHQDASSSDSNEPAFIPMLADTLFEFLPRFAEPYRDYLLQSSASPKMLAESKADHFWTSALASSQIGEQRLKSWLIEPVQRLPRYSLFLDNIIGLLPSALPSSKRLLKAKDMINDICALDHEDSSDTDGIMRLRSFVETWPQSLQPHGRFITALDATMLSSSSPLMMAVCPRTDLVLVMLSDVILLLERADHATLSARGLTAELDRPKTALLMSNSGENCCSQPPFRIIAATPMDTAQFLESDSGRSLSMAATNMLEHTTALGSQDSARAKLSMMFRLHGAYEGKASKWSEEAARARIEQRYAENLRESSSWSFRILTPSSSNIGLAAAVYICGPYAELKLSKRSPLRVILSGKSNPTNVDSNCPWASQQAEFEIFVTVDGPASYRVECVGAGVVDPMLQVPANQLPNKIHQSIKSFLLHQVTSGTIEQARNHVSHMQRALLTIRPPQSLQHSGSRARLRPLSPVKALTSLWSSGPKDRSTLVKRSMAISSPSLGETKQPKASSLEQQGSHPSTKSTGTVSALQGDSTTSLQQLESTLDTYVVAINCRAGNIVGKALRNRVTADEIVVNELYNTLNEDPSQHRAAAEVPVGVLFSAFEKFLRVEWSNRIGPVLSTQQLVVMQGLFDTIAPAKAVEHFQSLLLEASPQNRRALAAVVRLLHELLEASGNDGDRGALTVSFAELLAPPKHYQECIPILDKLVDDIDGLFDGIGGSTKTSSNRASQSPSRMHSVNSTSASSTGSSLRRRLGFPKSSRENSKLDTDTRVGQMWRTLSKKSSNLENDSSANSRTKIVLGRSRSTDRDRLRTRRAAEQAESRPGSAGSIQAEGQTYPDGKPLRNTGFSGTQRNGKTTPSRRRSSLSDLHDLANPTALATPAMALPNYKPTQAEHLQENKASLDVSRLGDWAYIEPTQGSPTRAPLAERKGFNDNQILLPRPSNSTRKRASNAHKIRDQLVDEGASTTSTNTHLQTELAELRSRLDLGKSTIRDSLSEQLVQRLDSLEAHVRDLREQTNRRLGQIRGDLDRSLVVSEQQRKRLEKICSESNAENELLYDRYNSELLKLFQDSQANHSQATLDKLQEAQSDARRLRKENQKLKRENALLKAELRA